MDIGHRLRSVREDKNLSQGDIEQRTGLRRCYISSVENGHTVPAVETLEKNARALEIPLYQLMYDGDDPPTLPDRSDEWGAVGKDARFLREISQRTSAKAIISGSIASLGSNYVITLEATNAQTGDSLARQQAEASGKEQVLKTLDKAATGLRTKLGESLSTVEQYATPL